MTHSAPGQAGASAVEILLALPILLLLGLGVLQFALIYQAKHGLEYALSQAARAGSVSHAEPEAILTGLAEGLTPWFHGAGSIADRLVGEQAARVHLTQALAEGWLLLAQRSPTHESFADWSVPALDPMGDPIAGLREIPNDNLDSRRRRQQPTSGVNGYHDDEPVGQASGQSLADANVLRLEMTYGMRLVVPIVGRWIIATLSVFDGCANADPTLQLGLVRPGTVEPQAAAATAHCAFYAASDVGAAGRLPIRLAATVRMMSTARPSDMTIGRRDTASQLASLGVGQYSGRGDFAGEDYDGGGRILATAGRAGGPTEPLWPAPRPLPPVSLLPEALRPSGGAGSAGGRRDGPRHPGTCP